MSKFNRGTTAVAVKSPVVSEDQPSGRTFEGAPGYAREARSELFLLAVSHLGEDAFYESAGTRDTRLAGLVRQVAAEDPGWMTGFTGWLRGERADAHLVRHHRRRRAEGHARAGKPGGRKMIGAALQRADEPGELLAYWRSQYGRKLPIALNRGISDAVKRLYTEFALLKYDSRDAALRFGDVIELVNPRYHNKEYGTWRDALYRYAIERRHGRDNAVPGVAADDPGERRAAPAGSGGPGRPARLRRAQGCGDDVGGRAVAGRGQARQGEAVGRADPVDGLHGAAAEPPRLR